MGALHINLRRIGAFLIIFIKVVLFTVFVMADSILSLLDLIVQIEVSVARSNFVLVELVLEVDSLWCKGGLIFFFFDLLSFNYLLFNLFSFRQFKLFGIEISNNVELSVP